MYVGRHRVPRSSSPAQEKERSSAWLFLGRVCLVASPVLKVERFLAAGEYDQVEDRLENTEVVIEVFGLAIAREN